MTTSIESQTTILAELWLDYRGDENFVDFIEYNDIGLPVAYAIDNQIVKPTSVSDKFIEETFDLLLAALGIEDSKEGFVTLDDLFVEAEK